MKNLFISCLLVVVIASITFAQNKDSVAAKTDSTIAKSVLADQYEKEIQQIRTTIDQVVFQLALADPIIKQRLQQLVEASTQYAQLTAVLQLREEDLKKVKPEPKKEVPKDKK